MKCAIVFLAVIIAVASAAPQPGHFGGFGLHHYAAAPVAPIVYAALPAPSSDTKIVRDALGNQATSYAYQDGHSSAVAVSRSDVSKHLVAAPVAYAAAPVVHHAHHAVAAPVAYHHAVPAPVHTYAAAPYHTAAYPAYHHYAAAGPAYYY